MKIREVIDRILAYHPKFPKEYSGCDDYKCGDPEDECTGVVTALAPNIHVIKEAIRLGANLIIVHEPTFYTSEDAPGWFEDFENEVYEQKKKLLDEHKIVVWRDHDHMHAHQPDAIFTGVLKYLGWQDKAVTEIGDHPFAHFIVTLDKMKLKELCRYLIDTIGLNGLRYVGDPEAEISTVAFVGHLFPMTYKQKDGKEVEYSVKVIETLEKKADVILPGEVIDWTTLSYVRDAVDLGLNKAVINIGHFNWEELGMKYMKDWLSELVENKVNVEYVPSEDMYRFIRKGE